MIRCTISADSAVETDVFLAREFGAKIIRLAGFDFEDNDINSTKKKKLKWVKKLIRITDF